MQRSLFAVLLALILILPSAGAAAITSKVYALDSEFTSIWNGLGRDAKGSIYIAAGPGPGTICPPRRGRPSSQQRLRARESHRREQFPPDS